MSSVKELSGYKLPELFEYEVRREHYDPHGMKD